MDSTPRVCFRSFFTPLAENSPLMRVAGAAHAGASGVAALNHEAGDDAVEDQAVVEALFDQVDEVLDGIGRDVRVQLGLD